MCFHQHKTYHGVFDDQPHRGDTNIKNGPKDNKYEIQNNVPLGRFWGCRNVKELVPNVRLARFHKELLPSLLSLPGGGEAVASSGGGACDISTITYSSSELLF